MNVWIVKVKNLLRITEAGSPSFAKNLEARADFIDSYKKKCSFQSSTFKNGSGTGNSLFRFIKKVTAQAKNHFPLSFDRTNREFYQSNIFYLLIDLMVFYSQY